MTWLFLSKRGVEGCFLPRPLGHCEDWTVSVEKEKVNRARQDIL